MIGVEWESVHNRQKAGACAVLAKVEDGTVGVDGIDLQDWDALERQTRMYFHH